MVDLFLMQMPAWARERARRSTAAVSRSFHLVDRSSSLASLALVSHVFLCLASIFVSKLISSSSSPPVSSIPVGTCPQLKSPAWGSGPTHADRPQTVRPEVSAVIAGGPAGSSASVRAPQSARVASSATLLFVASSHHAGRLFACERCRKPSSRTTSAKFV